MESQDKTKKQLLEEFVKLNRRVAELAAQDAQHEQSEQKLREVSEALHAVIHISPLAIIAVDTDSKIKIWNPAAEYLFGWTAQEVLEQTLPIITSEDKLDELRVLYARVLKGKSFTDVEMLRQKKDGSPVYINVSAAPLRNAKEKIIGLMAVIGDVSKRKAAEEAMRMTNEYYRLIVENSPDRICNIPLEAKTIGMDAFGAVQIEFNKPEEVCITNGTGKIIENRQEVAEAIKRAAAGETVSVQFKSIGKENKEVWWESKLTPVRGVDGVIRSILSVSRDITTHKLKESREQLMIRGLRAVVEAADDLITCADLDSLFKLAVEFARENLGMERCAIFIEDEGNMQGTYGTDRYGHTVDEHSQRFPKNEVWAQRLRLLLPQDPRWFTVEEPQYEWDGKRIVQIGKGWIAVTPIQSVNTPIGIFVNDSAITKTPVDTVKQEVLVVFCSLLGNIAERKRIEREREMLNKELIRSNKKLKQLAVMDSHTGLYNHRYFTEIIGAEFERAIRYNFFLSLLMLDIDYFKAINDVYGHPFGDSVLRQFAKQLKKTVRRYDIIIRFGGEEFLIISPGVDRNRALILAKRILNNVNSYKFGNKEHSVRLKLSLAVASYPEDKVFNATELIKLADQILSKVKEYGGNCAYTSKDLKKETAGEGELNNEVTLLKEKIERLVKRANQSLIEALFAFAKTLQTKDRYPSEQSEMTVFYAVEIAKVLGLNKDEIENVRQAAILYDLGKVGISKRVLLKCTKLSKKEFEKIQKHPEISVDIIRPVPFLHSLIPIILYHHERWDGKGYPRGLKGEEIIVGARILSIADTYKALTSSRPYRKKAYSKDEVVKIIKDSSGTQFDPKIVNALLQIIQRKR